MNNMIDRTLEYMVIVRDKNGRVVEVCTGKTMPTPFQEVNDGDDN